MVTEIPRATWRQLFEQANDLLQIAPWDNMGDAHVFGLVDPSTGQKCYGTVLGNLGNYYALALYKGKNGYKSLVQLMGDDDGTDHESSLYEQECLMVAFETEEEADPEDVALLESVAKDLLTGNRIPGFRSYRRGMMPWGVDEAEAELLSHAMQLCSFVSGQLLGDQGYLEASEEDQGKLRFFSLEEGKWTSQWDQPDSLLAFSPEQLQIDPQLGISLKNIPQAEGLWLFERFFFRQPSMDDTTDRPYFPVMFILLDLESQEVRGMDIIPPYRLEEDGAELLLELLQEAKARPTGLVVSNQENYILLNGLGRASGMEIHLDESLDVLPNIKAALYQQMDQEP